MSQGFGPSIETPASANSAVMASFMLRELAMPAFCSTEAWNDSVLGWTAVDTALNACS
jgi:hypothetical protein